jgi:membrane-bound serine protease (ClpP class)
MLPVQGWALLLLVLALIAIVAEFLTPIHGALAVVGIVLMIIAGLNLIDPAQAPGGGVTLWAVLGLAAVLGATVAAAVALALRVRAMPAVTGLEALVGTLAEVRKPLDPEGMVYVDGALWNAICENGSAALGDRVKVVGFHHMQLIVQHLDSD